MVHVMRIWLAPSRYAPHLGGIETVVAQLAASLASSADVLVLTHREPRDLPADELIDGVRIRRLRFETPSRSLLATARFASSHRSVTRSLDGERRPDLVHLHGAANQSFHLARYARRRRIPLVLTTHGEISGDVHDVYGRSAYARWALRQAARSACAVTAPSRHTLEEASALLPGVRHTGHVVPNGIDVSLWQQCPPPRATGIVLAWGRLEPQKGFDRLLAAWPSVRRELPGAELRIAGDGAQRPVLERMVSPGTRLLGRLDHAGLVRELAEAQFAAVPSRKEAFGMSALEALAAGRCVLHSGVPALADLVGPHGWTASHDEPAQLAHSLVTALRTTPNAVPGEAVAGYAWSKVLAQYRRLYAHACGDAPDGGTSDAGTAASPRGTPPRGGR